MLVPHRWPDDLDVPALMADGWRPKRFNQFVVKIHGGDQPEVMTEAVFAAACLQIDEHAGPSVSLVFHGGEPLPAGAAHLDRLASLATAILGPGRRLRLGLQTEGLIDDHLADVCDRWAIRVTVNLDGDGDRRGLRLLQKHRHLYAGLVCTVDPADDPVSTYEALLKFEPPTVDFLLPQANWARPPAGAPAAYGKWLSQIFDRWFDAPVREAGVQLFDDILALTLGGPVTSESVGLQPVRVAVLETDGTVAAIGPTGGNPLDQALLHPQIVARQLGREALCDTCRKCAIQQICGAGHYTHRFRPDNGFLNPSVYCPDLTFLIGHIRDRVSGELAKIPTRRRPDGAHD